MLDTAELRVAIIIHLLHSNPLVMPPYFYFIKFLLVTPACTFVSGMWAAFETIIRSIVIWKLLILCDLIDNHRIILICIARILLILFVHSHLLSIFLLMLSALLVARVAATGLVWEIVIPIGLQVIGIWVFATLGWKIFMMGLKCRGYVAGQVLPFFRLVDSFSLIEMLRGRVSSVMLLRAMTF